MVVRLAPIGRVEILVSDEVANSVMVLDLVFRTEDVTVWFGSRTLAVIAREELGRWLSEGGDLAVDDLVWNREAGVHTLTIDGNRTYRIDQQTVALLMSRV